VSVLNRFGLARAAIVTGSGAPLQSLPRLLALTLSLLRFSIRAPGVAITAFIVDRPQP
jgi:hypothetical protein